MGALSYSYDAGGRREIVNSDNTTVSYLYDGSTPVQITTSPPGGVTSIMAMPDSNEILSIGGGSVLLHDALGSTVGGVGSNGSLVFQYSYDPYGNFSATGTPPSGYGNVYGMAGIENDPSGLYHANARYYSPALTRFLSEDPERGKANMFTYAGENAITGSDIGGMDDCPLGDCAGGGDLGSGGSTGSGDDGFQALMQLLLGPFANFLSTSSSATPTIMNYAGPQLEAQFGSSFVTLGLQGSFNVYTQSGGIFLAQAVGPEGPPPIALPPGKNGEPNYWVPASPSGTGNRTENWKPRYPVPSDKGGQPRASWDPVAGHWDYDSGTPGGARQRFDRWGNPVTHEFRLVLPAPPPWAVLIPLFLPWPGNPFYLGF